MFSFLAGAVYTLNDLVDVEADRRHPTKCNRPIAAGIVTERQAKIFGAIMVVLSLSSAFALSLGVGLAALAYLANNIAYTFRVKHVPYLDVASIASGFVLRVIAGCYAVSTLTNPVRPSFYLLACTALLALLLGFGKRRHELVVHQAKARASLEAYSARTLDALLAVLALACVGVYVAYTRDPSTMRFFGSTYLWATTPFVVIGIGIFLSLARDKERADSPTDEMLKNVPFVVTLLLYAATIIAIVYKLRPTP
ncbi:MAG: UbiA prenyltransferase family protein [Deltaproteobacteria bacterium]|nr:UbiA prenyltransferase family protein [Deltaproteobacteria bacterium]